MYKKIVIWFTIAVLGLSPSISTIRGAEEKSDKNIELKTMSIFPASEPVPALSYRLLPHFTEQKTGNAALFYNSAAGFYPDGNIEDISEKLRQWRNLPIDQLDRKEVDKVLSSFSNSFHQIKLASERNYCQWEMPIEEGFAMQMPHLASFRNIIMAMQLQIKLYIAEGKIDSALELMRYGMYMGKSISEGPTIIQGLVGISISALMLKEAEGLIQVEDSPNLYWALASLPDPFIDLQRGIQTEREVLFFEFPKLRDLEKEILTPSQASLIIADIIEKIQTLDEDSTDKIPFQELLPAGWVMIHYSDAKKFLAEKGYSKEQIEKMPAAQVVLVYQKRQYVEMTDNMYKWFEISYYQSQPYLEKSEQQIYNSPMTQGIKANIFSFFMPALYRIAFLQARLERDIAMLRAIEAIRMFAANHSGQFPETLADITIIPIPIDPVTGKDFIYHKIDKLKARLEASVSSDRNDKTPVYELSIKQ